MIEAARSAARDLSNGWHNESAISIPAESVGACAVPRRSPSRTIPDASAPGAPNSCPPPPELMSRGTVTAPVGRPFVEEDKSCRVNSARMTEGDRLSGSRGRRAASARRHQVGATGGRSSHTTEPGKGAPGWGRISTRSITENPSRPAERRDSRWPMPGRRRATMRFQPFREYYTWTSPSTDVLFEAADRGAGLSA